MHLIPCVWPDPRNTTLTKNTQKRVVVHADTVNLFFLQFWLLRIITSVLQNFHSYSLSECVSLNGLFWSQKENLRPSKWWRSIHCSRLTSLWFCVSKSSFHLNILLIKYMYLILKWPFWCQYNFGTEFLYLGWILYTECTLNSVYRRSLFKSKNSGTFTRNLGPRRFLRLVYVILQV